VRCDECGQTATRTALNEKTGQVRALCKRDSKALPDSDTTRKYLKPVWKVRRLVAPVVEKTQRRAPLK
jgi:hypothetical protein